MTARRRVPVWSVVVASSLVAVAAVRAQDPPVREPTEEEMEQALMPPPPPGYECEPDEWRAFRLAAEGRHIRAREQAERIAKARPRSFVAHFVLGYVLHYGEANAPRALFELDRAMALYERRYGREPNPSSAPTEWHAMLLRELAMTHGDLDQHAEKIRYLEWHNRLYSEHRMLAERAWPLMKLGRFELARRAAREGLATGDAWQREVALNSLCAIEFEAGNDGASYAVCEEAMNVARESPSGPNAVDLSNFAEASRSVFKLEEAERVLLEASEADVAWYGNPWMELGDLYLREGRFAESLEALKQVPRYRNRRPPHVRDADRNESRRVLSEFFVATGRAGDALRITEKALVMPDRRAHNSRDPAQDRAIAALLDRRARLLQAEQLVEEAVARPFYERAWASLRAVELRLEAWSSGRQAARLLADDERLVGTFRIGTSRSAIMPPWLAGELAEVLGPGVVNEALRRARSEDERAGSDGYYDAFQVETAIASGDDAHALELARTALEGLGPAEVLLRARVTALAAHAASRLGYDDAASAFYEEALTRDPGVFRRLGLTLPVRLQSSGGYADDAASAIARSPRLSIDDAAPFEVQVTLSGSTVRACLLTTSGTVLGCGEGGATADSSDADAVAGRVAASFHEGVFAPRIDLTQGAANGLDGSNTTTRDPIGRGILDE